MAEGASGLVQLAAGRHRSNTPRTRRRNIEDIVNVDFYARRRCRACGPRCATSCCSGSSEGVRIFRVDNPHTKPLPFWQWMIAEVRARHPDVIFLSEAFTRPKMMYRLAKIGFSQSYTYFTWRNTKQELTDYLTELTHDGRRRNSSGRISSSTRRTSIPYFLQTSGRARLPHPRGARGDAVRAVGRLFAASSSARARRCRARRNISTPRNTRSASATANAPGNIVAEITRSISMRKAQPGAANASRRDVLQRLQRPDPALRQARCPAART